MVAATGEVRTFVGGSVRVGQDGAITVKVGDYQRSGGDETPQRWQVRRYAWNGTTFRQVSGPTAFPVNPRVTETGVTTGELVLGPAIDGVRHGTVTVTVTYLRGARPDHVALALLSARRPRPRRLGVAAVADHRRIVHRRPAHA